ncbi:hypothetical protein K469DRAFT_706933 [Zopfia rhizophila CBS 207.26]|uniref:Uncharacterized protein n=1 Tax=Zopfia rhizophila CBS 207.26 TaxID=1314779 RepID=A0A6A6E721_9PEZI|nr:hypothetical protein K469DRAFT_706933 [Zopfia rhizophila CBS 207.26]
MAWSINNRGETPLPFAPPSESSMNHAGRTSKHTFADLRSAQHARDRTRTRIEKYYHFRGVHQFDLPTSAPQQAHYRPYCTIESCRTFGTPELCCYNWGYFPTNLDGENTFKFTKREAYEMAQDYPRPPTYHHSRYRKDLLKWQRQRYNKKLMKRELDREGWREQLDDYETAEAIARLDIWYEWYQDFGDGFHISFTDEYAEEGEDEGYMTDEQGADEEEESGSDGQSACDEDEESAPNEGSHTDFMNELHGSSSGNGFEGDMGTTSNLAINEDVEWDLISNASSAWTEVESLESFG